MKPLPVNSIHLQFLLTEIFFFGWELIASDTIRKHVEDKHVSWGAIGRMTNLNTMLVPCLCEKRELGIDSSEEKEM
jgi:hypothetical protein